MPWSMISPPASMKSRTAARRGGSGPPATPAMSACRCCPETLTTPMPPRPGAVAMAAMVSSSFIELLELRNSAAARQGATSTLAGGRGFAFQHARDAPLLRDRKDVVDEPVQHQAGWKKEEENAEHDRHDLHHLRLHRIRWLRVEQC